MSPKNEPAPDTEAVQDASGAAGHSERAIEVARQSGGGLVSRNACFAFVVGVLVAIAAVAAFHVSERSAVRRADADALGLVVDRTADHLAARVTDRGAALDTETFSMLQSEIVRLAEVRGVQQAALVFERGAEIIAAQSSQFTADHGGARLPVPDVDGPGRFLADNHLLVARSFLLRPGDDSEALLVVRAGFPSLESHMRDLVSLGGRIVGITALLLVFLLPLAGRAVFRAHTRAAQKARDGDVPDPVEAANGGRELVDLVLRIAADAERVRDADRARVELADRARAELGKARDAIARERETAQSALSEARDARAARANFVANMSHEIRTPLHAVMGTTALLLETELSADQRSLTDRSMRAARTLLSLVDDVLDLTRFDARQVVLDSAPFDPGALVEEIAEVAAPLAAQKGLDVAAFVSAECPAALMGDTARIRQALMRLVDNAIKFTDTGEVTVDVGWEVLEDGVPRALFTVSDTGIGVGEDERTRLFQAFEQIDGSNTRRHGGVGLGLALVARIARAAHGEVRIQSRAGQGARFTLALPLETADGTRGLADRVASRRTPLDGVSVLILDDAEHASRLLARTLQGLGAQTRIEPSTYSGFETFVAGAYDLVLLDGDLAGRDAFLGALVSHETKSEVPVVLMTTPLSRRDVDEAGGDALVAAAIRKPLSRAAVEEVALRALGRLEPDGPEQPEDVESTRETRKAMLDTHLRRRIRVLLVEDNQTNQQLVQYILSRRGYIVDVASNGRKGVHAFGLAPYDAILMDCQMPEMDGYEATRRIRELEAERGVRTPILAMTASVLDSDRQRCADAGMDDMLSKPFQPHRMVEWLEGWLLRTIQQNGGLHSETPGVSAPSGLEAVAAAPMEVEGPAREAEVHAPLPSEQRAPGRRAPAGMDGALDDDVLGALLDDEEGRILASELIESFLETAPDRLRALEQAARAGDLGESARIAHALVSTSGTVGAVRFAHLLRDIERFAQNGNTDDSIRTLERCREEIEVTRLALVQTLA